MLENLYVVREVNDFDVEDATLIHAFHGRKLVLVVLDRITLDDLFPARSLTRAQRILLADRHVDALARIASAKFSADEWEIFTGYGSTLALIRITLADIKRSGETITATVLDMADRAGFANQNGKV